MHRLEKQFSDSKKKKKILGKLRLGMNLKPLNKPLKRNIYPMPTTKVILPDLSKAIIFSGCDVKYRFRFMKLDDQVV